MAVNTATSVAVRLASLTGDTLSCKGARSQQGLVGGSTWACMVSMSSTRCNGPVRATRHSGDKRSAPQTLHPHPNSSNNQTRPLRTLMYFSAVRWQIMTYSPNGRLRLEPSRPRPRPT